MRKWLHPSFFLAAFLALFTSVLPAQGWFCPMTGRVGSAAVVCEEMPVPCEAPGSLCCQRVALGPIGVQNAENGIGAVPVKPAPQLQSVSQFDAPSNAFTVHEFLIPKPCFAAPATLHLPVRERGEVSLPATSRDGPADFAGRAPPVA